MRFLKRFLPCVIVLSITLTGCYEEKAKIVDDYWFGDSNKYNGWAIAIDGNFTAIGNPQGYNVYGFKTGSVYIAERLNGNWLANPVKTAPTNLDDDDFFGYSVGMDADRLIVGANHKQEARIYKRLPALGNNNLWYEQDTIVGSDVVNGDSFGVSVDISGDWAIVGAPYDDNGRGTDAGAVYFFQWTGSDWVQRVKRVASDGAGSDIFGWSVAMHGDWAVVGAPYEDNQRGGNAGSIYVFQRNGANWYQSSKHIASDGGAGDYLGASVAIWGNYILAGAYYDDNSNGNNAGAAYFYVRDDGSFSEKAKLIADDGAGGDLFGISVAITDYFAVVGAPYNDHSARTNAGAAYVYYRSGDELAYVEKRTASDAASGDLFGYRTAIDGYYAVFSALYDDNAVGTDAGSAYVFEREE